MSSRRIPHSRPDVRAEDREAVVGTLTAGWLAGGPATRSLEDAFVALFGGGAACAVSSGSAALMVTLRNLGLPPRARVAVPTYACPALLGSVSFAGAVPVPVDVDPQTLNIDVDALASLPEPPDAAIAVHTFGIPADSRALLSLGIPVVEDCCHSLGGRTSDGLVGAHGTAAAFSFYATKVIGAGQGGMIWSADVELVSRVRDLVHPDEARGPGDWFNFQISDLHAALAVSQLGRLESIRARRALLARRYLDALERVPGDVVSPLASLEPGPMIYRFVLLARSAELRDQMVAHFDRLGIDATVPIPPDFLLHRLLGLDPSSYPFAEGAAQRTVSVPLYPALEEAEVHRVCGALASLDALVT